MNFNMLYLSCKKCIILFFLLKYTYSIFSKNTGTRKRNKATFANKNQYNDADISLLLYANQDENKKLLEAKYKTFIENTNKNLKLDLSSEKEKIRIYNDEFTNELKRCEEKNQTEINIFNKLIHNLENGEFKKNQYVRITELIENSINNMCKIGNEIEEKYNKLFHSELYSNNFKKLAQNIKDSKLKAIKKKINSCEERFYEVKNKYIIFDKFLSSYNEMVKILNDKPEFKENNEKNFNDAVSFFEKSFNYFHNNNVLEKIFSKKINFENTIFAKDLKERKEIVNLFYRYLANIDKVLNDEKIKSNIEISGNKRDIDNSHNKYDKIFTDIGIEEGKRCDFSHIKDRFKQKNEDIETFYDKIRKEEDSYSKKINESKNKCVEINKKYQLLKKLNEKITSLSVDVKLKGVIYKGDVYKNINTQLERYKNAIDDYENFNNDHAKKDENFKDEVKKYKELKEQKAKYIKEFVEEIQKFDNTFDYYSTIIVYSKSTDYEKIIQGLDLIKKQEDLLKKEDFILTSDEDKKLNDAITAGKNSFKNCIDELYKKFDENKKALNSLENTTKNLNKKLNKDINDYNQKIVSKQALLGEYVNKVSAINEKVIKIIKKYEQEHGTKDKILKEIKGLITKKYLFDYNKGDYADLTFTNGGSIECGDSFGIEKLNDLLGPNNTFRRIINNESLEYTNEIKKNLKKVIEEGKKEITNIILQITNINKEIEKLQKKIDENKKDLGNYNKQTETIEKFINEFKSKTQGDKSKSFEAYKDDDYVDCRDIYTFYDNISKGLETYENTIKSIEDQCNNFGDLNNVDDKYNDLKNLSIGKYKINELKIDMLTQGEKNTNLLEYYKSYYLAESLKSENLSKCKKNKLNELEKTIAAFKDCIIKFCNEFVFFSICGSRVCNLLIINDPKFFERHEDIPKDKIIFHYLYYFLEYFDCKKAYLEIENYKNKIYNLLIEYKSILNIENINNDTILDNIIEDINNKLKGIYDKFIDKNGENDFLIGKTIVLQELSKIIDLLRKGKFNEKFKEMCDNYCKDKSNAEITLDKDNISGILDELAKCNEFNDHDGDLNINKSINLYGYIENISQGIKKFYNNCGFEDEVTDSKINLLKEKKLNLILGNGKCVSELKVLEKDSFLSKIISEYFYINEGIKDTPQNNFFNEDKLDINKLNVDDANVKKMYHILKYVFYFQKILDKKDGVIEELIKNVTTALSKLYGNKIIDILDNFDNLCSYNDPFVNNKFYSLFYNEDTDNVKSLKGKLEDFLFDKKTNIRYSYKKDNNTNYKKGSSILPCYENFDNIEINEKIKIDLFKGYSKDARGILIDKKRKELDVASNLKADKLNCLNLVKNYIKSLYIFLVRINKLLYGNSLNVGNIQTTLIEKFEKVEYKNKFDLKFKVVKFAGEEKLIISISKIPAAENSENLLNLFYSVNDILNKIYHLTEIREIQLDAIENTYKKSKIVTKFEELKDVDVIEGLKIYDNLSRILGGIIEKAEDLKNYKYDDFDLNREFYKDGKCVLKDDDDDNLKNFLIQDYEKCKYTDDENNEQDCKAYINVEKREEFAKNINKILTSVIEGLDKINKIVEDFGNLNINNYINFYGNSDEYIKKCITFYNIYIKIIVSYCVFFENLQDFLIDYGFLIKDGDGGKKNDIKFSYSEIIYDKYLELKKYCDFLKDSNFKVKVNNNDADQMIVNNNPNSIIYTYGRIRGIFYDKCVAYLNKKMQNNFGTFKELYDNLLKKIKIKNDKIEVEKNKNNLIQGITDYNEFLSLIGNYENVSKDLYTSIDSLITDVKKIDEVIEAKGDNGGFKKNFLDKLNKDDLIKTISEQFYNSHVKGSFTIDGGNTLYELVKKVNEISTDVFKLDKFQNKNKEEFQQKYLKLICAILGKKDESNLNYYDFSFVDDINFNVNNDIINRFKIIYNKLEAAKNVINDFLKLYTGSFSVDDKPKNIDFSICFNEFFYQANDTVEKFNSLLSLLIIYGMLCDYETGKCENLYNIKNDSVFLINDYNKKNQFNQLRQINNSSIDRFRNFVSNSILKAQDNYVLLNNIGELLKYKCKIGGNAIDDLQQIKDFYEKLGELCKSVEEGDKFYNDDGSINTLTIENIRNEYNGLQMENNP